MRPAPGTASGGSGNGGATPGGIGVVDVPAGAPLNIFAENQAWSFGTPEVIVGGYGARAEFVIAALPDGSMGCATTNPPAFDFDGARLGLSAQFPDMVGGQCRVELSGDVSACLGAGTLAPGVPCELTGVTGTSVIGGTSTEIKELRIARFERCTPIESLAAFDRWGLMSAHPLVLPAVADQGVVTIFGERAPLTAATATRGLDNAVGCSDNSPSGMAGIVDGALTVDVQLDDLGNTPDVARGGNCSITFQGAVAYCSQLGLNAGGATSTLFQVIRYEGTGSWTIGDDSTDLPAVYFVALPQSTRR